MKITVSLTTKNRYYSTLSISLTSILNQTMLPHEIILVDDNEKKDFYNIEIYKNLIQLMMLKNVTFSYYHGQSKGQVHAQQIALEHCKTDLLFKMDDDNILESNVLETLYNTIIENDNIAAVSGLIFCCDKDKTRTSDEKDLYNKIENVFSHFNIQMCGGQSKDIKKCEHLYSNYLFRTKFVESYPLEFSPAGHREDTVFTYSLYRKGYDLFVNPNCITYHIHNTGGNKSHGFEPIVKNEEMFLYKLENEWGVVPKKVQIKRENNIIYAVSNGNKFLIYSY
jgi:glycosyltransferase involved in cell wall biosynthesis